METGLGDLAGWVSYTWGRSLRQEEAGHLWRPHDWDQPHNLVTVLAWDLPGGWVLASRFRISSGFPVDEDIEYAYDVLIMDQRCIADPTQTGRYANCPETEGRLPANHSLDFKISRTWSLRSWTLEGYLDVQNVYNRRNPEPVITGQRRHRHAVRIRLPDPAGLRRQRKLSPVSCENCRFDLDMYRHIEHIARGSIPDR